MFEAWLRDLRGQPKIPEETQKSIIAMKGAPFTRKTEFATVIATSLSCPALFIEDFLDILDPDHVPISPSPQDLAFRIMCQMSKTLLSRKVANNVVIDSPLPSRSQLDQLIELAKSLPNTRLVVVECKPQNTYLWHMKFDEYFENHNPPHKWYKAKNWEEVEKAITIQDDYVERSDGLIVSKLILDPLSDHLYEPCVFFSLPDHISKESHLPPFVKAVQYMITRKEGDGPNVVVYHQWRRRCCRDGHTIIKSVEQGLEYEVKCNACGEDIKGSAYTCDNCRLSLHKNCAESYCKNTWGIPRYIINGRWYSFPQLFACTSCNRFSNKCASCLFKTQLKNGLMPIVIRHDCEGELLSLVVLPADAYQEVYNCSACGTLVQFDFYSCKNINGNRCYHLDCLTKIPSQVKHVHGGHHHHMLLKFSSSETTDDFICDECLERRDPQLWFYSCQDCQFVVHLHCILEREVSWATWTWIVPTEK